jgi:hypothetical protein
MAARRVEAVGGARVAGDGPAAAEAMGGNRESVGGEFNGRVGKGKGTPLRRIHVESQPPRPDPSRGRGALSGDWREIVGVARSLSGLRMASPGAGRPVTVFARIPLRHPNRIANEPAAGRRDPPQWALPPGI